MKGFIYSKGAQGENLVSQYMAFSPNRDTLGKHCKQCSIDRFKKKTYLFCVSVYMREMRELEGGGGVGAHHIT